MKTRRGSGKLPALNSGLREVRKVCTSSTSEYPVTLCLSLEHTQFLSVTITAIRLWGREGLNALILGFCIVSNSGTAVLSSSNAHVQLKYPPAGLRAPALHPSEIPPPLPEQNPSSWFSCLTNEKVGKQEGINFWCTKVSSGHLPGLSKGKKKRFSFLDKLVSVAGGAVQGETWMEA